MTLICMGCDRTDDPSRPIRFEPGTEYHGFCAECIAYEYELEARAEQAADMAIERRLEDMGRELDPEGYAREDAEYAEGVAMGVFSGRED